MEREIKKKVKSPTLAGIFPQRPRKLAYFVGRANELGQLKEIVRERGMRLEGNLRPL